MQMQKCSGCLWARCCSKKCQKQHLPCHKPVCLPDTSFQQLGFFGMSCPWEERVMATRQHIIECTLECTDGSYAKDWSVEWCLGSPFDIYFWHMPDDRVQWDPPTLRLPRCCSCRKCLKDARMALAAPLSVPRYASSHWNHRLEEVSDNATSSSSNHESLLSEYSEEE